MGRTLPAGTLRNVTDPQPATDTPDDGPTTLRLAVLVLWIEAVALAVLTVVQLFLLLTREPESRGWGIAMVASLAAAALLAGLFGRWLVYRRRWARSPAIVLQGMALPIAVSMVTGPGDLALKAAGVVVGAVALLGAGLLLAPSARGGLTMR
jgi:hypothetical protein